MSLKTTQQIAWLAVSTLLLLGAGSCAAAVDPASDPIPAKNVVTLRENIGQEVTVRGRIATTGESPGGIQFLNFANSELTAVCYPEQLSQFRDGKPATLYREKNVLLTGEVELYKNKLQIRLRTPSQILIVTEPPQAAAKGIKLKKLDKETWISPAGLRYHGRDPAGLTRIEHIERHVRDEPSRAGSHGVFDGGSDVAFAVIDEAWTKAQEHKIRAEREGDRSTYTVSMGRRIGYLGGRTGAARRNPPLSRVFIVFKTGTKDIVTAFPK